MNVDSQFRCWCELKNIAPIHVEEKEQEVFSVTIQLDRSQLVSDVDVSQVLRWHVEVYDSYRTKLGHKVGSINLSISA